MHRIRNCLHCPREPGVRAWLSDAEEIELRKFIAPVHVPEFDIAVNTGLRRGEQYEMLWEHIDFGNKILTVPRTKNGEMRHVPLNQSALRALGVLKNGGVGRVFSLRPLATGLSPHRQSENTRFQLAFAAPYVLVAASYERCRSANRVRTARA